MNVNVNQTLTVGACVVAILAMLSTLPIVVSSLSEHRANEVWDTRALLFTNAQDSFIDTAAPTLVAAKIPLQSLAPVMRDIAVLSDIEGLSREHVMAARENAEQKTCLSQAIYYEARSETLSGQKAVAEVVLNRVSSKHFPETICSVVYQGAQRKTGCQFSFTCDGSLDTAPTGKAWARAQTLAEHMLIGIHKPMTHRSTHYHTTDISPVWAPKLKSTRIVGSHAFYRFKNRREAASSVTAAP